MKKSFISFEESNQLSRLILDYINNKDTLSRFYSHKPVIESYKNVIDQKNYNNDFRPILVETISRQYAEAGIQFKKQNSVLNNIDQLIQPNTFTVTTGHQLCLFTGPLYFIYKILTTIKWCDELKAAYPENNFVPVFWMASEDHDFAEVNHIHINTEKIEWNIDSQQQPVGHLPIMNFEEVAATILSKAENDFAKKQLKELIDFYTTSENLSIATRKLVHHLFGDRGLVIIDADSNKLKELFIPYMKKDVLDQRNFEVLQQTNNELKKQYKTQVNGREINFFYLSEQGRKLIKQDKEYYKVEGTGISFTKSEIEKEIEQHPEKFSPNVILRPLYQEIILPNLSYVGGPGEIAYWLQLKGIFELNGVAFPVLTLRNLILLVKEQHNNQLEKTGLTIDDLFDDDLNNERKLVRLNKDGGQKIIAAKFDDFLQDMIEIAQKTDNKISSELIKHKVEWKDVLLKINKQLDKQQRAKIENKARKLTNIKYIYFRHGIMQERFENILSYGVARDLKQLLLLMAESIELNPAGIKYLMIPG